jgi:hypothetical protein
VAEVVKLHLVDVGTIGSLCGVNFALFDELLKVFFVGFLQGFTVGGHRPWSSSWATFMAVVRVLPFFSGACMRKPH